MEPPAWYTSQFPFVPLQLHSHVPLALCCPSKAQALPLAIERAVIIDSFVRDLHIAYLQRLFGVPSNRRKIISERSNLKAGSYAARLIEYFDAQIGIRFESQRPNPGVRAMSALPPKATKELRRNALLVASYVSCKPKYDAEDRIGRRCDYPGNWV